MFQCGWEGIFAGGSVKSGLALMSPLEPWDAELNPILTFR